MIRFYKASNNGEVVLTTDSVDLDEFTRTFGTALLSYIHENPQDMDHEIAYIVGNAFNLAFKIAGYKVEKVHESRLLVAGFAAPNDSSFVMEYPKPRTTNA